MEDQQGGTSENVEKSEQNNETVYLVTQAPETLVSTSNEIVQSPDIEIIPAIPAIDVSTTPILESNHHSLNENEDGRTIVQAQSSMVVPETPVVDIPTPIFENNDEVTQNSQERADKAASVKEPSAPPPSIEIPTDSTQIQDDSNVLISHASPCIEPTAPPPSIEIETENTIGENGGETFRPRSQIITHRESVLVEAPVEQSEIPLELEPFTDEQLNHFYYNQELHQVDFFVNEFLKVRPNLMQLFPLIYLPFFSLLITLYHKHFFRKMRQ